MTVDEKDESSKAKKSGAVLITVFIGFEFLFVVGDYRIIFVARSIERGVGHLRGKGGLKFL